MFWPPSRPTTEGRQPDAAPSTAAVSLNQFRVRIVPFAAVLASLWLAGCASLSDSGMLSLAPSSTSGGNSDIAQEGTLSVVTTRNPVNRAAASPYFGSER